MLSAVIRALPASLSSRSEPIVARSAESETAMFIAAAPAVAVERPERGAGGRADAAACMLLPAAKSVTNASS